MNLILIIIILLICFKIFKSQSNSEKNNIAKPIDDEKLKELYKVTHKIIEYEYPALYRKNRIGQKFS